jgi:hypothetical protein
MEKPHTFAGRVIKKFGKTTTNDYEQPDKFFADMHDLFRLLDGIPFSAVEDLEKYEINRDVMVEIVRRIIKIFAAAKVDIIQEINRIDEDPFDGLEQDLEIKKSNTPVQIRISGETEEK